MRKLPKKVEDWTKEDCNDVLYQLNYLYRRYNINKFYVVGSRCNGIDDPHDIDICVGINSDIISWRNLNMQSNYSELLKRAILEGRMNKYFGEKFNIILEKEFPQTSYNTIEKFPMPYFDLETRILYNRDVTEKLPYKIITYDYDNHVFYMKLRSDGLTQDEVTYYTNKMYENLTPKINQIKSISESDKSFMAETPVNVLLFLINCAESNSDLDEVSKNWIKNRVISIKSMNYIVPNPNIHKGMNCKNSDLFVKLFHDCEIYENLFVF